MHGGGVRASAMCCRKRWGAKEREREREKVTVWLCRAAQWATMVQQHTVLLLVVVVVRGHACCRGDTAKLLWRASKACHEVHGAGVSFIILTMLEVSLKRHH